MSRDIKPQERSEVQQDEESARVNPEQHIVDPALESTNTPDQAPNMLPVYDAYISPYEQARSLEALDDFFDFRAPGEDRQYPSFRELDQREADTFTFYNYSAGRYDHPALGQIGNGSPQADVRQDPPHTGGLPAIAPFEEVLDLSGNGNNVPPRMQANPQVPPRLRLTPHAPLPGSRSTAPGTRDVQPFATPSTPRAARPHAPRQNPTNTQMPGISTASQAAPAPTTTQGLPTPIVPGQIQAPAVSAQPPPGADPATYLRWNQGSLPRNVQWPMNVPISIMEICIFCPAWFQIPEAISRAIRNGWTSKALAKAQLLAEDPATRDSLEKRRGKIQKQVSLAGKMVDDKASARFNSDVFRDRFGQQNDLTANTWQFVHMYDPGRPVENVGHMRLDEFYRNLDDADWPAGDNRLQMTQCLEFARSNPQLNLDTSHWAWIIQSQGFAGPPAPQALLPNREHRDVDAFDRLGTRPDPR